MANEFWNVIMGIVGGFIIGMVVHSAMGHTWGKRLWEIFHKGEQPYCYGKRFDYHNTWCTNCDFYIGCEKTYLTSTE